MAKERGKGAGQELPSQAGNPDHLILELLKTTENPVYPMQQLRAECTAALEASGLSPEAVAQILITDSPQNVDADFGFHCGPLAKILRKNPAAIAQEYAAKLKTVRAGLIAEYVAVGSYINIRVNQTKFASQIRDVVLMMGQDYGKEHLGTGHRVFIDMSSPNIAKQMSIGHLRSTIIGDALARIYRHLGYDVVTDNHIGDWGTQFGHLLRAIELWGDPNVIAANPIVELQKLYVRITDAGNPKSTLYDASLTEEDAVAAAEAVQNEGRKWFKKLEDGDQTARELWQKIVDWSMTDFQRMYDLLGVTFDMTRGESYYESMLADATAKVEESGIATISNGALVVNLDDVKKGVAIIRKSDGTTLYLTREIATAIHRQTEKADSMIYVVGADQILYFEQFFEILHRMGYPIGKQSKHVWFGMITLPDGKMSTRRGRVVLLQDVVDEAVARAEKLVAERTRVPESEKATLVKQMAIGSLKWNDLKTDPRQPIVFDIDKVLAMEGNSAPYVMYAHARAKSLLQGVSQQELQNSAVKPSTVHEKTLLKLISAFPEAVEKAGKQYDPSQIATLVYELAKAFSIFYHNNPILREPDPEIRMSRLTITAITAQTIKTGLYLLGIETPDSM